MNNLESWGIIDLPIDNKNDDKLEIQSYIDALAQVITTTRTPMTISIQGDWGSGKTSFVKMVLEQVGKTSNKSKFSIIEFNTWEYSKFEMEDVLPTTLVCKIAEEIIGKIEGKNSDYSKVFDGLKKTVFLFANTALSYASSGKGMKELMESPEKTPVDLVLELKNELEAKIAKSNKEFIIFIDDLDRLPPLKALEVLETLQLFLHIKNCVFILAVDYEVVSLGYKQKMGSENYPDWKSKNFFDKIIQLPFTIPNPQGTHGYLKKLLTDINFSDRNFNDDFINTLTDIVNNSIQFNPRNLKRLMNSFGLLKIIIDNKIKMENRVNSIKNKQILFECLFFLLCMQLEYPEMYDFYVQNYENLDDIKLFNDIFQEIAEMNIDDSDEYKNESKDEEENQRLKDLTVYSYLEMKKSSRKSDVQFNYIILDFLRDYEDIFNDLSEEEHLETLKEAINLSITTSNTARDTNDQAEKIGKYVQRTIKLVDFTTEKGKKSLEDLKDPKKSKEIFGVSYTVLKDVEDIKDSKEKLREEIRLKATNGNSMSNRYYAKPVVLSDGRHYLVTSEWYRNQRESYEEWLNSQDMIEQ